MNIDLLPDIRDMLGESAIWDDAAQAFFWVDINARKIRRYAPAGGALAEWTTPDVVGSIGLVSEGELVAALRDGFYRFDLATSAATAIALFEHGETVRFNDGKADRFGRFLSGTMVSGHVAGVPAGKLHRLDRDGGSAVLETGIAISNALCFSPDGGTMYFADSMQRVIWAYDYDGETGAVGNRRGLVDVNAHGSAPDGATVDAEGFIWVALVLNGRLARFSPSGALDRMVELPVPHPTCPAFGGAALDTLLVTSIADSGGLLRSDHADAGRVVILGDLGTAGIAEPRYIPARGAAPHPRPRSVT